MATTPVPDFVPPPDFPALSDRALGTYNSKAYAWATAIQSTTGPNIHAIAVTAKSNADAAAANTILADEDRVQTGLDRAATAADRVQTGLDRAQTGLDRTAAADSAVQASKLNLGRKSAPPATDNQGAALLAGATYYDTTLGKWRVWTGVAWGDGISAVAGVSSINGDVGDVVGVATLAGVQTLTNKTLTGYTETVYNLAGTDIAVANGSIQTKTLAANTTFTESLADGQSVILGITAGAFSVTWPSVTWTKVGGSGVAPTLTSSGVNWIILWQVGGVVRGSFMGTA